MPEQDTQKTPMVNLTIDGKAISVPKGTTVYKAAQQLGLEIPIFCYHDRMPPFGACRVCLVEIEKNPKPQTSCTLEATEGMVVKTQSAMATEGRESILEFLLINHPLDCPICDRGGECPLQEHVFNHGPGLSRFFEEKRKFKKPLPLGPVLMLDRERCIMCARCTRFGELLAGDHALQIIERSYKTQIGTPDEKPAESKFIGNTIMICPVGALTSGVYRFRARPWDNDATPSTCTLCPVGCSLVIDSRDGEIMRTRSKENKDVNDIWLCDKGWFGYEFVYNSERLTQPLIRREGNLQPASWDEAISLVANKIREAKTGSKLAGLGGNPLTTEENFLFQKLMRTCAGVNNVDHRVGTPIYSLEDEGMLPGMENAISDCETLPYVLLLGLDLTEEFPVIWLRLRQAINKGTKVIFVGHYAPEIAPYMDQVVLHTPGQELQMLKKWLPEISKDMNGKSGAIFVGRQYLQTAERKRILAELLKFQQSNQKNIALNLMEGKGNSTGARLAGMRPDLKPLGEPVSQPGLNALQVVEAAAKDGWDFLYIAGANPALKFPSKLWQEARGKLGFLVVQDLFLTETAQQADVVLPTLAFVEKGGSFINIEGRVQTIMPGKETPESLHSDAEIFRMIAGKLNVSLKVDPESLEKLKPGRLLPKRPESIFVNGSPESQNLLSENSLFATFAPALFDRGVRMNHNPNVSQLVKEPFVRISPQDGVRLGIHDKDSIHISLNGGSLTANVKIDPTVAEKTIVIPLGFPSIPVYNLQPQILNGVPVVVKKD
jgi:NADH-quinone oxidoreductase subunit G